MVEEALTGSEATGPPLNLGENRADVEEEKVGEYS
jgi:hypothetical protein